jgi:hypothetical protein
MIRGEIKNDLPPDHRRRLGTRLHGVARQHDPVVAPRARAIRERLALAHAPARELAALREPGKPASHRGVRALRAVERARHGLAELAERHVRPARRAPGARAEELSPDHPHRGGPLIKVGRQRGLEGPVFVRHEDSRGTETGSGPKDRVPRGSLARGGQFSIETRACARGKVAPTPAEQRRVLPGVAASRRSRLVLLKKRTRSPSLDSSRAWTRVELSGASQHPGKGDQLGPSCFVPPTWRASPVGGSCCLQSCEGIALNFRNERAESDSVKHRLPWSTERGDHRSRAVHFVDITTICNQYRACERLR